MNYKDNIEWLKSLKRQLGQIQHKDLWHFEQVIDETIANLEPPAKPHGRLIDADELIGYLHKALADTDALFLFERIINRQPTIIEAEVPDNA